MKHLLNLKTVVPIWTLPFIKNQNPPITLLIDTGSMNSLLNPCIAEKYNPNDVFESLTRIKTAVDEKEVQNRNKRICRIQNHFDDLIGLNDRRNMNLFLYFIKKILHNEC